MNHTFINKHTQPIILYTLILLYFFLLTFTYIKDILFPIIISFILVIFLDHIVIQIESRGIRKTLAISIILILLFGTLLLELLFFIPLFDGQIE